MKRWTSNWPVFLDLSHYHSLHLLSAWGLGICPAQQSEKVFVDLMPSRKKTVRSKSMTLFSKGSTNLRSSPNNTVDLDFWVIRVNERSIIWWKEWIYKSLTCSQQVPLDLFVILPFKWFWLKTSFGHQRNSMRNMSIKSRLLREQSTVNRFKSWSVRSAYVEKWLWNTPFLLFPLLPFNHKNSLRS